VILDGMTGTQREAMNHEGTLAFEFGDLCRTAEPLLDPIADGSVDAGG
jgi:hypothetical protein